MDSRKRVLKAIEFNNPDRVPFFSILPWRSDIFYITYYPASNWQPQEPYLPYIDKYLFLIGNWRLKKTISPKWLFQKKRKMVDEFGCIWEAKISHTIGECVGHPIDDWEKIESFQPPDPFRHERFQVFETLARIFGKDKFLIGNIGNCIWERAHFLRGYIQIMQDLITAPEKVCALIDKIMPWYKGLIKMYSKMKLDGVIATDDWGMQKGLMISPHLWRQIFKPRYKELIDTTHNEGMKFILHSCGDIQLIIPDLIEIGLDVLQKDDPECVGVEKLADLCAGKLCIYSPLDLQRTLPRANGKIIRKEVKKMIKLLSYGRDGVKKGGLIGMVYVQPQAIGIPWSKFFLMDMAFKKYGKLL